MKIAIVSGITMPTPSPRLSSIERFAGLLAEEMAGMGLDVTLYASGDSKTAARLRAGVPVHLAADRARSNRPGIMGDFYRLVASEAANYDIINVQTEFCGGLEALHPFGDRLVVTVCGFGDPSLDHKLAAFRVIPVVGLSDAQRSCARQLNWAATIGLGLPRQSIAPSFAAGGYLAYLGGLHPGMGLHRAVRVAQAAGMRLKVVSPADLDGDDEYRTDVVAPLMGLPHVEFCGDVDGPTRIAILRNAAALLHLIDGQEGFGMAMIEAMACGTPVIGWRKWSVPEVIDQGVTGYIVDSMDQAIAAVGRAGQLDRRKVRGQFDRRFGIERMALQYHQLFRDIVARREKAA